MEDTNKCIILEKIKNSLKGWAISLSALVLAGSTTFGILMVLFVWFIINCIITAYMLSEATDENGNKLDTIHMMNTMSTSEWSKTCKKILDAEYKKRWLDICITLIGIACFAKLFAIVFMWHFGVEIVTWL